MDPAAALERAAKGDEAAWTELVEHFAGLVWSVARGYRLGAAATDDVVQTVWLRLAEHCERIRQPDRLGAWLATTTRNEALRVARQSSRFAPEPAYELHDPTALSPDEHIADADDLTRVMAGFARLSSEDQQLLRLLCAVPPLDYETIAEMLGRPIGSIGPTRARCLERLRKLIPGGAGTKDGRNS